MKSIELWGIVLPGMRSILGKPCQTLRVDSTDKPLVKRLEYHPDERMVVVELAPKPTLPEMPAAPNTVLIPEAQISSMVPMPKKQDKKYELFADDDDPTPAEQLAKANARAAAYREAEAVEAKKAAIRQDIYLTALAKEATKAKLPDEAVSSSKLSCLLYTSPSPRDRQRSRMPSSA